MFTQEISATGEPDLNELDASSVNRRLVYQRKLKQYLQRRFSSEDLDSRKRNLFAELKQVPLLSLSLSCFLKVCLPEVASKVCLPERTTDIVHGERIPYTYLPNVPGDPDLRNTPHMILYLGGDLVWIIRQ
ncbi:hypothetical protein NPIL_225141 [Nephila pilipes]|uniref:Uncharacterized protein n=1 Tax=Nephila pilipes TaxID=299642 RepID=A0A8X6MT83_NEPPI|nr:hypothetical protein NPIL_225141 [Nephila pilipes]